MTRLPAISLLLLFVILSTLSMRQKSATSDELVHLASGYVSWINPEHRLNLEHPPLIKMLSALPFYLKYPTTRADLEKIPGFAEQNQWVFSRALLLQRGLPFDDLLFAGRLVGVFFGTLTCLFIFLFARGIWGIGGANLALFLACFCPNLLAHSGIIHTDVPLACGFIATAFATKCYVEKPGWRRSLFLGAAIGFALSVKFAGVLVLPAVAAPFFAKTKDKKRHLLGVLLLPIFFMSWPYRYFLNPLPYLQGLQMVYHNHDPQYAYFMNGSFSSKGFLFYYPFAMALKIPFASLLAIFGGAYFFREIPQKNWAYLLLPVGLVLLAGILTRHNIGVRHALPAFPFLFVIAGGLTKIPLRIARLSVLLILPLLLAVDNLNTFPDYLAYFSPIIGGPQNGLRYLDDSNIDWGQDLKRLPQELQRLGIAQVKIEYHGQETPEFRNIPFLPMQVIDLYFPNGDYVVSAQYLRRHTLRASLNNYSYDWLENYRPAAVIGHSLYIYRFRVGDSAGFQDGINWRSRQEWIAHGFSRLEKLVQDNATFYPGVLALAEAHVKYGNKKEALRLLIVAQKLEPDNPQPATLRALLEKNKSRTR